jgi:hypothetical protein
VAEGRATARGTEDAGSWLGGRVRLWARINAAACEQIHVESRIDCR